MPQFFSLLLIITWTLIEAAAAQQLHPAKRYVQRYTQAADRITITLTDGQLVLRPLAENAIRVQFT